MMPGLNYCYIFTTVGSTLGWIQYCPEVCTILQDVPDHTGTCDPYARGPSLPGSTLFPQRKYYIGWISTVLWPYDQKILLYVRPLVNNTAMLFAIRWHAWAHPLIRNYPVRLCKSENLPSPKKMYMCIDFCTSSENKYTSKTCIHQTDAYITSL